MAAKLNSIDVKEENLVVLFMDHSIEVICSILGVLKAGAGYVPIDITTPKNRISFILEDIEKSIGKKPVLITQPVLLSSLPENQAQYVVLDEEFSAISNFPNENSNNKSAPNHLAYIIFTSGSTGIPKGVMIEHRSLTNYIYWANKNYNKEKALCWPLFSSLAFDLTVTSIFTPLISGGTIIVYKEKKGVHGAVVFSVLEDNSVDIIKLTPTHLAMIKDYVSELSKIRTLIVGGENFKNDLAVSVYQKMKGNIEIYNEYGPTESTVGCMIHQYKSDEDLAISVPIGIPAANTNIFILDENLNPVPIEVNGEMFIAGDGLARGYFNRLDLTSEKFILANDPRDKNKKIRLYKSGDMARWNINGKLEFLGRVDNQVKVGGVRIELEEIEASLMRFSHIKDCVVDVYQFDNNENSLNPIVAYYISEKLLNSTDIQAFLINELPSYMIPQYFIALESFPVTSNGKIDRKALPKPKTQHLANTNIFIEPISDTEKKLATIWRDLLKIEKISTVDDFFELGGHSLLALQVITKIRQTFKIDLPAETLFEKSTIKNLSTAINAKLEKINKTNSSQQKISSHLNDTTKLESKLIDPFYFNSEKNQLFAVLYRPKKTLDKKIGVVICAPILHEYLRTHWILRQIATVLTEIGYHSLVFDYSGTGDSTGDYQIGGIMQWALDTQKAEKELRIRSEVNKTIILGARLGSIIASHANIKSPLVFWDPINNGTQYIKELEILTAKASIRTNDRHKIKQNELGGFLFPQNLKKELMKVESLNDHQAKIIISSEYSHAVTWDNPNSWTNAILSGEVVKAIVNAIQDSLFFGRDLQ